MTTGYSRAELDEMEALFAKRLPRLPNEKDKRRLAMVDAASAAGSPYGLLIRMHVEAEQFVVIFLNPVVTMGLFHGINRCAIDGDWWAGEFGYVGTDMPVPTSESAKQANEVISLTTASAGDAMIVHFVRRGGSKQILGFRKQTAIDLFLTIEHAGRQFGLWDSDFQLLAAEQAN